MMNKNSIIRVIFATSALGMGVNMPYISQIIHIGPPSTLEAYVQEIDRAGRSEDPSSAILYYYYRDISELKISKGLVTPKMKQYCLHNGCLRKLLLQYLISIPLNKKYVVAIAIQIILKL